MNFSLQQFWETQPQPEYTRPLEVKTFKGIQLYELFQAEPFPEKLSSKDLDVVISLLMDLGAYRVQTFFLRKSKIPEEREYGFGGVANRVINTTRKLDSLLNRLIFYKTNGKDYSQSATDEECEKTNEMYACFAKITEPQFQADLLIPA